MALQVAPSSGQHSQATTIPDFSPIAFKQQLLAALNDECEIMCLLSEREWSDPMILQFQGVMYILVRDVEALPRSVHLRVLLVT